MVDRRNYLINVICLQPPIVLGTSSRLSIKKTELLTQDTPPVRRDY